MTTAHNHTIQRRGASRQVRFSSGAVGGLAPSADGDRRTAVYLRMHSKVMLLLLLGAVLPGGLRAAPALSVSLAIPRGGEQRSLEYYDRTSHFHVVISNLSNKPKRVWKEWCSWGYFALRFEVEDEAGRKWTVKKKDKGWTMNAPDWWVLEARESVVLDVFFADQDIWAGFPRPDNGSRTVLIRAVFEAEPDKYSRQYGIWTGQIVSEARKVKFTHWRTDK